MRIAFIAVLVALVAFDAALDRVGRLAFLDQDLDAIDAAFDLIDVGEIIDVAGTERNERWGIRAGAIGKQRIELLAGAVFGEGRAAHQRYSHRGSGRQRHGLG